MTGRRKNRRTIREKGPDPVDVHVGKRVRQGRLDAGFSQDQLGQGLGVSFQAVQKYEQGENRLSASRLFRAAQMIAQPVSFFFDGLDRDTPTNDAPVVTPEEFDLIRNYRQIASKEVRDQLLRLAKRLSKEGSRA